MARFKESSKVTAGLIEPQWTKLQAVGEYVLLEMSELRRRSKYVILPESIANKEWPWEKVCKVISMGDQAMDECSARPGDLVILEHYRGDPVANRHRGMITVKAKYVIATVDREDGVDVRGNPRDNW